MLTDGQVIQDGWSTSKVGKCRDLSASQRGSEVYVHMSGSEFGMLLARAVLGISYGEMCSVKGSRAACAKVTPKRTNEQSGTIH